MFVVTEEDEAAIRALVGCIDRGIGGEVDPAAAVVSLVCSAIITRVVRGVGRGDSLIVGNHQTRGSFGTV